MTRQQEQEHELVIEVIEALEDISRHLSRIAKALEQIRNLDDLVEQLHGVNHGIDLLVTGPATKYMNE